MDVDSRREVLDSGTHPLDDEDVDICITLVHSCGTEVTLATSTLADDGKPVTDEIKRLGDQAMDALLGLLESR